jgi:hypothetical protein
VVAKAGLTVIQNQQKQQELVNNHAVSCTATKLLSNTRIFVLRQVFYYMDNFCSAVSVTIFPKFCSAVVTITDRFKMPAKSSYKPEHAE